MAPILTSGQIQNKRQRQEDRLKCDVVGPFTIMVVCDGMGGHPEGDVAAELAVEDAMRVLKQWCVENSNNENPSRLKKGGLSSIEIDWRNESRGCAVFVAVVYDNQQQAACAMWLGDSSAILVLDAPFRVIGLTPQHLEWGCPSKWVPEFSSPSVAFVDLSLEEQNGYPWRLILFSDGLDPLAYSVPATTSEHDKWAKFLLNESVDSLMEAAVDRGSEDNISIVSLRGGPTA